MELQAEVGAQGGGAHHSRYDHAASVSFTHCPMLNIANHNHRGCRTRY